VTEEPTFRDELTQLINRHGWDSRLGFEDFNIADFLCMHLGSLLRLKRRDSER
jgi:hypothetical protein